MEISFSSRLFLRSNVEGKKGNGPDVRLILHDGHKPSPAKKWKTSQAEVETLSASRFLLVSGSIDKGGKYDGEITITALEAASDPEDVSPYLPPLHKDHGKHLERFDSLQSSIREPNLRLLIGKTFDQSGAVWSVFPHAYAAGKMHHAYPGGLMHHTVEVAELCASACEVLPTLNRCLLITGALLHDIGKLNEMDHSLDAGEYTPAGILNGHISLGAARVRQAMNSIKGFPSLLKESVFHLIISHHGCVEFGSPKMPMFAEAQVLAECDLISARVFQFQEAKQNANGRSSVWLPGKDGLQVYTGDLGLQQLPVMPAEAPPAKTSPLAPFLMPRQVPAFVTVRLPVRGLVAAGTPEQSSEEEEETREAILPSGVADYLVRVTGDSMIDAGIHERDLLLIKSTNMADDGDIVVAHIAAHGQVVKRFRRAPVHRNGHRAEWLESENRSQNYPPILCDEGTEIEIQGKVVGPLKDQS